ncbi:hypothetical protein IGI04_019611, partial [Brassica rapa subsp. trilocularis]
MSTKSLGCQMVIKGCCRHPFRPRNLDLCSMQKTWLEAKEIYENLPENSFNHSYEACKKSNSNSKYFVFYIKNTPGTQPMSTASYPPVPERVCSVGLLGSTLSRAGLRSMAGLSPVNFPGTFPANFLADRFAPSFKFLRLRGLGLFWFDRTHSFRISPNPGTKSVKENTTKQPAFTNPETVFVRKQCCN